MKFNSAGLLGLALLCAGCSPKESQEAAATLQQAPMNAPPPSEEQPEAGTDDVAQALPAPTTPTQSGGARAAAPVAPRLLIYHAAVRVKAASLVRASARLDSLVRRSGGYVSAATESREDGEWRAETTIRVLPSQFQPLLTGLSGLGTVEEKKLSTDDVTAEHADVAARLRTKRAVEARYVALLARVQRIKDVLEVEEKVGEVREAIEATESRLKTLNDEVAYSTITLHLYQPLAQPVPDAPVVSFASRLVEAFYGGWQLLTSLLVGVVAVWPLLLLGGLGLLGWRHRQSRLDRPAALAKDE